MDKRADAREVTFKLVFEYLFSGEANDLSFEDLAEEYELNKEKNYVYKVYHGVIEHFEELSNIIAQKSIGFSIDRIYKVDKAILLLALYEILHTQDIPYKVSVNEAVNLAKKYGTEKSGSFVNGILAKVEKK